MLTEPIEECWIDAFVEVFSLCKLRPEESVIVLTESRSRAVNVHLAELALARMGSSFFQIRVPSPPPDSGPIIRSSGASYALTGQKAAVAALAGADFIVDLTVEGLMHAPETAAILKGGARIMNVSNEHPEALTRLVPGPDMKDIVKDAVGACRGAKTMTVTSEAGTELAVSMTDAATVGVWGWTDRAGTLAHWPGGIVVSFPRAGSVNGRLVFRPGDMNLTFKKYFDSEVVFTLKDDYVTDVAGSGTDAHLMRAYLEGFGDSNAFATSHVGWGLSHHARYEALTMYDRTDTNCTELRAVAGNFLYSTGANEFANRFTKGHFDLPMMGCTIALDDRIVVDAGKLTASC